MQLERQLNASYANIIFKMKTYINMRVNKILIQIFHRSEVLTTFYNNISWIEEFICIITSQYYNTKHLFLFFLISAN